MDQETEKTPLWKQVAGALGGAAAAFVLYQGYSFGSTHLQGLLALPTAPGVVDQSITTISTDQPVDKQNRIARRIAEIAARFGRANVDSVEVTRSAVTVEEISPEPVPVVPTGDVSTGPVWPIGTISEPNVWNGVPQAPSSVAPGIAPDTAYTQPSTENRLMYGPFGWLQNVKKYGPTASASSESSVPQIAQVAAPSMALSADSQSVPAGEPIPLTPPEAMAAQESSSSEWMEWSSSSEDAYMNVLPEEPALMEDPVEEPMMQAEEESTLPDSYEPPAPLMASMTDRGDHLPQSGFGLELLAITAIGAALGRRATRRA